MAAANKRERTHSYEGIIVLVEFRTEIARNEQEFPKRSSISVEHLYQECLVVYEATSELIKKQQCRLVKQCFEVRNSSVLYRDVIAARLAVKITAIRKAKDQ